jgi:hypothetical protein
MVKDKIQTAAFLLEQCSTTIKRFNESYKQTGGKYNIFKVTGISTDEVKTCKIIGDLLNPKGDHYKGDCFLKYFIDIINEKMPSPLILDTNNAQVKNEYLTDLNRRIDIVIEDGNIFLPIEVKIFAGDQEKQVSHYAEFSRIKNKNKNVPVIYLTIEGNPPSNANEGEYIPISFRNHILKWLNKCLRNADVEQAKPVFEVLKQLIASIKSMCGISEDEKMEKAIQGLITQSEDNVNAALAIKQAVDSLLSEANKSAWELFSTKIISQIQKTFPDACCDVDEGDNWYYLFIPIKNGKYLFGLNYDWCKIYIQVDESNKNLNPNEINALHKKMTELTGKPSKDWKDFIWANDKYSYPRFSNIEPELYFYKLHKDYLENTTEVVNMILSIANELNKV